MTDVTFALSEQTVRRLFQKLRDEFRYPSSGRAELGALKVRYETVVRLENGDIDFRRDGTVKLDEVDIVLDPLFFWVGLDLPQVCVGGYCVIPKPFGGCLVRLPRFCIFEGNPDIELKFDLSRLVRIEVSATCSFDLRYYNNPAKGTMNDWDAHAASKANEWRVFLNPGWIDIDFIDIADIVGDLFANLAKKITDTLFSWMPDWAKSLINAILGGLERLIRTILDIGDDIEEWLSDLLGVSLGLFDLAAQFVLDYLAQKAPIFGFEDPYPIMKGEVRPGLPRLVPVLVPIVSPSIDVDDREIAFSLNVGP
jgi:hypothetical protein